MGKAVSSDEMDVLPDEIASAAEAGPLGNSPVGA